MKSLIDATIVLAVGLLAPLAAPAQGTLTYLSSLGPPSVGSEAVAGDSWLAEPFLTGSNPGGYSLDSIQLAMAPASGAPSGFTLALYSAAGIAGATPGISLGTFSGSPDPATGNTYAYTASDLLLSPSTTYFIVLSAGTPLATGAYAWSVEDSPPPTSIGGWSGSDFLLSSSDGSSWQATYTAPQFDLTATPTPEPGTIGLLGLSGLMFLTWHRQRANALLELCRRASHASPCDFSDPSSVR